MFMNLLCVGLIAIPVGYYLILTLGIHGTVLSMIATSLATCLLSWRVYRRDLAGGSSPGCRPTRRNLASQPTVPLAGIPLASGEETEQLLRWSRGPVLRAGEAATVLDLIRQHVARSPEAAALVCDRATLTYAALNQQALGLARQLQSQGAGPGTFVGILLERSSDWLWALVGVLESGAAYLPLDPATPPGRLGEILRDARPAIVVTSRALADRLAAHMELVCLTEDVKPVTGGTGIPPDPDSPAYLIYTSGSMGRPKGVVATHRNLLGRRWRDSSITRNPCAASCCSLPSPSIVPWPGSSGRWRKAEPWSCPRRRPPTSRRWWRISSDSASPTRSASPPCTGSFWTGRPAGSCCRSGP